MSNTPGQVQVGPAVKIQLVLQHLVHGIRRGSILRDLEFGDLLLAGVAGRVGRDVGGSAFGVDVLQAGLLHMEVMEAFDDLVGIDL
jgi:hypothetical protein